MQNLVIPAPPPSMDTYAPEFCLCGRKTVESHEFWFCSTECARQDSLRSLDDPECHYRNMVRKAYVRAGVPELYPRRMTSADHLRPGTFERRGFAHAPPRRLPPMKPPPQGIAPLPRRDTQDRNAAGIPAVSQVAAQVLTQKSPTVQPLVPKRRDRSKMEGTTPAPSRTNHAPAQRPQEYTFHQISLDAIPLPDPAPPRSLRRVPQSSDSLKHNIRKSVVALLNVGRSHKDKEVRAFGHPVNTTFIPPVRWDSLPSNRAKGPSPAVPVTKSNTALRRSASFAGWNATPRGGPSNGQDPLMHIIQELREDCAESFDPKSLFALDEPY